MNTFGIAFMDSLFVLYFSLIQILYFKMLYSLLITICLLMVDVRLSRPSHGTPYTIKLPLRYFSEPKNGFIIATCKTLSDCRCVFSRLYMRTYATAVGQCFGLGCQKDAIIIYMQLNGESFSAQI